MYEKEIKLYSLIGIHHYVSTSFFSMLLSNVSNRNPSNI